MGKKMGGLKVVGGAKDSHMSKAMPKGGSKSKGAAGKRGAIKA